MGRPPVFIIAGAGLAGAGAAEALRNYGFDGRILLIGAEPEPPYLRPPLSKGYLQDPAGTARPYLHDRDFYDSKRIELRTGTAVERVNPESSEVELAGGERLRYDRLLISTGSSPRKLALPGADLDGILSLHTLADAERLHQRFEPGRHLVVVGAGWIGCEVAAAARGLGLDVTLLSSGRVPLERQLGPEIGAIYAEVHREHGVRVLPGTRAARFEGEGAVERVLTTGGDAIGCDLVVAGVGARPATGLVAGTGIEIDNGILVNEYLETSVAGVFAAGDVANTPRPLFGRLRVEHWSNALNQGPVAARNMLGHADPDDRVLDHPVRYEHPPYFYSDQYEFGMELSGHPAAGKELVFRGDPASLRFMAFWLNDRKIVAGMNVNIWDVQAQIQALVRSGLRVDPGRLADPGIELTDLAPEAPART